MDLLAVVPDHCLKVWPEYFDAIVAGTKPFDVRKGEDRQYKVWDVIAFLEWDPKTEMFTGRATRKLVSYVLHGGPWLPPDTWVLGLRAWC